MSSISPPDRRLARTGTLAAFVVSFLLFGALFTTFPVLYDTDSYYHLAIARVYVHEGVIDSLPWARFSLMSDGFGDKELLFHVLLAPFTALAPFDPLGTTDAAPAALGGRWALAFLNALLVGALTWLGIAAVGRWGFLVPWLVYAGSADFLGRMVRLRPELLSLLLLLVAIVCAARRRDRLLGLVTLVYTLSYTAFHALLGLCFAWFVVRGWSERRWSPQLVLYPVLGAGLGLLLHPHFPHNLAIWKVQSVDFFTRKAELNVGAEIAPATTDELLWLNLGWIVGLVVLWRAASDLGSKRSDADSNGLDASTAWTLHVATAAFGLLYLLAQRFSIYFVPLATLSLVYEVRRRGLALGPSVALPGRGRLPLAVGVAAALVIGLAQTAPLVYNMATAKGPIDLEREDDWAAFARAVPPGARVAAEWGSAQIYMFWAPQGSYLNVLDPVFMALPYPRAYETARAVFEGREPDIPLALEAELDSRFLALSSFHPHPELLRRLRGDPRLVPRYQGYTSLYEVVDGKNAEFLLDWRLVPPGRAAPPALDTSTAGYLPYPRAQRPEERAVEAFVDAARFELDAECVTLVHDFAAAGEELRTYELAAYGPSTLWLDQIPLVSTRATGRAVVGAGITVPARLAAGDHRFTVLTCQGRAEPRRTGFFLRGIPSMENRHSQP